ncbi:unnamed protein product [Euphydryas editha]|uniref:Uncharacterized protein n=1 Tax=Euphydryas editha TaxID=104508 RepID=A0AAU9UHY6_EUPED|nr:unnamed protein product [Euphydryas editha]
MLAKSLLAAIVFQLITATNVTETNDKIKQLENEKNELFKQINEAIDASVKSLQKSNETDALIGIKYMYDLKEYLMKENDAVIDDNYQKTENDSDVANRRNFKIDKKKKSKNDPFNFESILKPKKITEAKWREMMTDRAKMQKQLNEWIMKREKEKERFQQYKLYKQGLLASGKYEKCPRFGYRGKKKKAYRDKDKIHHCKEKITESDLDEEYKECANVTKFKTDWTKDTLERDMKKAGLKISKKKKYPCCRKCCKKSYMGCL